MSAASAIHQGFMRSVRRHPNAMALHFKGRDWSYRQLSGAVLRVAQQMADRGVIAGDRVAFFARNSDRYAIGWLATQALGAVHVPINFMLTAKEVAFILGHAEPKILYAFDECGAIASQAVGEIGADIWLGSMDIDGPEADAPEPVAATIADAGSRKVAQLAYTSGTESAPKGALLTDSGLVHEYLSCIHAGDYDASDVTVHALPLFHCAQLHCFLTPQLFLGSRNIILDSADAATIIATIAQVSATSFFAPPTVWIAILNHPSFQPEALRSLKKGYYGASIMPAQVLQAIRAALPWLRVWNFYGQTEIGPLATVLLPEEHDARPTSAGRPALFVESRVVDDDMRDVGPGEIGELVHRSPQLLEGYYRDPEKTAEAFRGGWFHSGDLAIMDEQGYLKIVDRKKDMIKSGGENVASREVEEVIYQHPAVAEVAVFGLPDPKWVERVCAAVVLRQGAGATADEIIAWTAKSLAPFKRPKQVVFCEVLPKNASGKILKKNLRVSMMAET